MNVTSLALVPGLPHFDLLFVFTIIHGTLPCTIVNANGR